MDYLVGGVFLHVAVVLVFATTSRQLAGRGVRTSPDRDVTVARPVADEPTPGAGRNVMSPGAERRIPPA